MNPVVALVREALVSAWSQRVASIVTVIMIAGMCTAVLLTTGRTVGAEDAVLHTIDSAGTRAIVVSTTAPDAGLDSTVLGRLAQIDGIEWAAAFGPAIDVTNAGLSGGTKVPTRTVWGHALGDLGIGAPVVPGRVAWASPAALERLGLMQASGGVVAESGDDFAIVGALSLPDYLDFLEPAAFVPEPADQVGQVAVLVVVAGSPALVAPIADATMSVLGIEDPSAVSLQTSTALTDLRAAVQGQLGQFGRTLVLLICGVTGVLVAAILFGLVMLRRKDYGRRRALGATRRLVVALVLVQTVAPALLGALVGCAGSVVVLAVLRDPLPDVAFIAAVGVLSTAVAVIAALVPALIAAAREPIRELRVP